MDEEWHVSFFSRAVFFPDIEGKYIRKESVAV